MAALPSYKAHRVPGRPDTAPAGIAEVVPDGLAPQVPVLLELLAAAGIATAGAAGYEADDVIGTLAAAERTDPVLAVSGDRDLMQIVRDEPVPVRLLYVGRGLAKAELLGPAEVAAKYGVPAARAGAAYAELAMLRGDPSDGLPGVPGIGAKTAATLVGRFARGPTCARPCSTAPTGGWPRRCGPSWPPRPATWPSSSRWCGWRRTLRSGWTDRTACPTGSPTRTGWPS